MREIASVDLLPLIVKDENIAFVKRIAREVARNRLAFMARGVNIVELRWHRIVRAKMKSKHSH